MKIVKKFQARERQDRKHNVTRALADQLEGNEGEHDTYRNMMVHYILMEETINKNPNGNQLKDLWPEGGSNPLKGDSLVIGGSMLYAVSNVGEEFLVKKGDRVELMAMLGLFGAFVSAGQISILERTELKSIHWTTGAVLPFVGFDVAMFLFYSTVPIILKMSGSTMLNLSLLTSDMWAVLIRIFAYHQKVDWMYFISFGAVAVGLVVYSGGDKEQGQDLNVIELNEVNREADEEKDEEAAVR